MSGTAVLFVAVTEITMTHSQFIKHHSARSWKGSLGLGIVEPAGKERTVTLFLYHFSPTSRGRRWGVSEIASLQAIGVGGGPPQA